MKISKIKFVGLFLASGFVFVFLYDVIILSLLRGRPANSESFLSSAALTGWRSIVSAVLYPIKFILIGPMGFLLNLPDPPPPFVGIGFAMYWALLALIIYYAIDKLNGRKSSAIKSA